MSRNSLVWIVVVVTLAGMLAAAPYLTRRAGLGKISDQKGKPAPDFALESLDGGTVHLSDFRGKAILVNFWATWCQPCKIEMPWFEELRKQYGPQGFEILGIAADSADSRQAVAKFVKEMGVNYPILIGKERVNEEYGGIEYLPSSFVIDRDGKLVTRFIGLKSRSEIEDDIKQALNGGHIAWK